MERILSTVGKVGGVLLSDGSKIKSSKAMLCTDVWTNKLLQKKRRPG
ncbi:MAG: hypothetical protein ACREBS_03550 [Nitrososphaerales archaeon]